MTYKAIVIPLREDQARIEEDLFPEQHSEVEFETLGEMEAFKAGFNALSDLMEYHLQKEHKTSQVVSINGEKVKFPIKNEAERSALMAGLEAADGFVWPRLYVAHEVAEKYETIVKLLSDKLAVEEAGDQQVSAEDREAALSKYATDEKQFLLAVAMGAATSEEITGHLDQGKLNDLRVAIGGCNDTFDLRKGVVEKFVPRSYDPVKYPEVSAGEYLLRHPEEFSNTGLREAVFDAIKIFGRPFSNAIRNIPTIEEEPKPALSM